MQYQKRLSDKCRGTINPYLHYGNLLYSRLVWDFSPYSWISMSRIRRWKNKFKGRKAIILCNGPSLKKVDFRALQNSSIFTFGLNKINLIFKRTKFRPSAIVAVNPFVIEQNASYFNQTLIPLFIDHKGRNTIAFRRNVHFLHGTRGIRKFARDCSISIAEGATVTFVAMQLSFHMGFESVALIGCDHSFSKKGPPNQTVTSGCSDADHFDEKYFADGKKWQLPDLLASELQYDTAKTMFENYNKKIINCTEGGNLEIFERKTLAEFMGS